MSEMKHTPGPWTVEEYGDRDYPNLVLHSDSETRVCFMATPGSNGDPARIAADAALIAAAPDLIAALRTARAFIVVVRGDYGPILQEKADADLAKIDAALAKAQPQKE